MREHHVHSKKKNTAGSDFSESNRRVDWKDYKRWIILIAIACTSVLVLLRDVNGVSIPRWVFISIATIAFIISDKRGIYCFIAYLAPLATGISATYITAIALMLIIIKQNKIRMELTGLICLVAIMILELFSAVRGMFSFDNYFRFAAVCLFSFSCMLDMNNEYDSDRMINTYLFGFWVALASVVGQMLRVYSFSRLLKLDIRLGNTREYYNISAEGFRVSYNPNGLGVLCLVAIILSMLMYKKHKRVQYIISFVFASILGIMTRSVAFIIVYIISMLIYTILSCDGFMSAIKNLATLLVGGTMITWGIVWTIPEYVRVLIQQFQTDDISNGRTSIAAFYYNACFQRLDQFLLGVGIQNYPEKYNYINSAHNATQEVMIAWGIVGLLCVILLFASVIHNGHTHNKNAKPVQYLPLMMYLLIAQSGQGFSNTSSMLLIMVTYMAILLRIGDSQTTSHITSSDVYSMNGRNHGI